MSKSTMGNCFECLFKVKEHIKINETVVAELNYPEPVFLKYMIHLNILMFCSEKKTIKLLLMFSDQIYCVIDLYYS